MNKSIMTSIIVYSLLMPAFACAGKLSDFAGGASGSSGGRSGGGSGSSSNDDCGFLCLLIKALASPDRSESNENSVRYYPAPPPEQREEARVIPDHTYTSDFSTLDSLMGAEFTARGSYGHWDDHLYAGAFDLNLSLYIFTFDLETVFDHEGVGADQDSMQTVTARMGLVYPGENNFVSMLFGVTSLNQRSEAKLASFGLRHEYRSKWWGTRAEANINLADDNSGFYDLYAGGYLRKKMFQVEAGWKRRSTLQDVANVIEGPEISVAFRFGNYHDQPSMQRTPSHAPADKSNPDTYPVNRLIDYDRDGVASKR